RKFWPYLFWLIKNKEQMSKKLHYFLTSLLMMLMVQISIAQEQTVSGTVTDGQGMPLPGVNILVKEAGGAAVGIGTQSDLDGNYSIAASSGQVLVFSYLGFETQERVIGNQTVINIVMQEDASELEEVVVTGVAGATS